MKTETRVGISWVIIIALAVVGMTTSASAQEAEEAEAEAEKIWSVEADTGWYSKYIWRGQDLGDDTWQSGITVSGGPVYVNVWHNHDFDMGETTELDYTAGVSVPLVSVVSLDAGYIYYTFPHLDDGDESHEVYAGLAADVPYVNPYFTYYYDWEEGDGSYYEAGVSHSIPMGDYVSLDLGVAAGYSDQWGYDSSFTNVLFTAGIPVTWNYVSLTPSVAVSVASDDQYDDEVYAGASLAVAF